MFNKIKNSITGKRFGLITLIVVAAAFTIAGFGMAASTNWKPVTETTPIVSGTQSPVVTPFVPASFAELAKKLSGTVVNIKVTKVEKAGNFFVSPFNDDAFRDFFKPFMMPQMPENHQIQGAGSGVIISKDGYILTNNHVVEGSKKVIVTLNDKDEYSAQIVGLDPKTDLAVLKIKPKGSVQVAVMGDSDKLQVGDWVLAIGNPFGLSHTVTSGIVSAKGRVIGAGPYDNFIQTDASINPGNSGGPLFNMQGEIVGINTAILPNGQGIGFAIPINTSKPLIPQLMAKGEVTRGYLGVSIQTLSPELAKAMNINESKGVLVADLVKDGPAEKAGIERGDLIVSFNKKPIQEARDLSAIVADSPVGEKSNVTVIRNGKQQDITVKLERLASEKTAEENLAKPASGKWGLMLQDLTPQLANQLGIKEKRGVIVSGVQDGSPAEKADIHQGDIILEVNRHPVASVEEAKNAIKHSETTDSLVLLLQRDAASFYVALSA
ncbi:MAG: DegQ family serine endoprotease [Proteobacteria bacterium]|nr:DegQ family serine endoprotease [Pseudomonadota bacterium]